jgi:O-antigen/teichoic acid export membrane protein
MSILLARTLGPSGKGTLSIVQQVGTMGATLLNFGFGAAFIFYGARKEADGRDAVKVAAALSAFAAFVLLAVFGLGGEAVAAKLVGDARIGLVLLGAVSVFPVLMAQLLNCYNVGSGTIRKTSLINVGALAAQLVAYVTLLLLHKLTPTTAVIVWVGAISGAMFFYIHLARTHRDARVDRGAVALYRRAYRYGLAAWIGGGLDYAALRQDVFLLAFFKNPAAVGVYSIAVTLAELSLFIPGSLNGVLTPKIAAEGEGGLEIALRLCRLTWPVTLVVSLTLWVIAIPVVPLVFGKQFAASLGPFAWLIPGMVGYAMASMPGAYVRGIGHPKDWTIASATNVVVNLAANVVLIPRFGASGAAMASSISYNAMAIVGIAFFLHRSKASLSETLIPRVSDVRELSGGLTRALRSRFGTPA